MVVDDSIIVIERWRWDALILFQGCVVRYALLLFVRAVLLRVSGRSGDLWLLYELFALFISLPRSSVARWMTSRFLVKFCQTLLEILPLFWSIRGLFYPGGCRRCVPLQPLVDLKSH